MESETKLHIPAAVERNIRMTCAKTNQLVVFLSVGGIEKLQTLCFCAVEFCVLGAGSTVRCRDLDKIFR